MWYKSTKLVANGSFIAIPRHSDRIDDVVNSIFTIRLQYPCKSIVPIDFILVNTRELELKPHENLNPKSVIISKISIVVELLIP